MKLHVLIFLSILFVSVKTSWNWKDNFQENIVSVKQGQGVGGIWKSNIKWKAHWVKEWEIKKVFVPVWRKIWGPVDTREWIPLPKPPIKHVEHL